MTEYSGEIKPLSYDLSILKKLNLEKPPVGIKFLFNKPDGVRRLDKNLAFCLMPEEAQNSGAFYVDESHFECAGPIVLGIAPDDPYCESGQIGTKPSLDIFQQARANRRIYKYVPTLDHGTCHYVIFAPLDDIDFDPDVLLITGNAHKAEIVLRAYSWSTGAMYQSKSTTVMGCAWAFVYPFISGEINFTVEQLCYGHRARQVGKLGDITVSIPFDHLKTVIDNLHEMDWLPPGFTDGREGYNTRFKQATRSRLVQR